MSKPKLILGDKFVQALTDAGLLPERTLGVVIRATVGEPVEMTYEVFGDERLLDIAGAIEETDDPEEAIAR